MSNWLFMQVVAHLCEGTLGGSRSPGAEDGYWTGQNEIHSATLQVNAFICFEKDQKEQDVTESFVISLLQRATVHTSVFRCPELIKTISKCPCLTSFSPSLSLLGKFTTSPSTARRQWRLLRSTVERCTPSQPCWWPKIWKLMAKCCFLIFLYTSSVSMLQPSTQTQNCLSHLEQTGYCVECFSLLWPKLAFF